MDHHAVAHLDGDLGEVFVAPMHRVAGLERGDGGPALAREQRPGFLGPKVEARVALGVDAFAEGGDLAREIDRALRHHLGDAGMRAVVGAEHAGAFERLVDGVFLGHPEGPHDRAGLAVDQRDLFARRDPVGEVGLARQRDRDRPEQPIRESHIGAYRAPIGMAHESVERRVRAHRHHHQVRSLAARHRHDLQPCRALQPRLALRFGHQQRTQLAAAMRG